MARRSRPRSRPKGRRRPSRRSPRKATLIARCFSAATFPAILANLDDASRGWIGLRAFRGAGDTFQIADRVLRLLCVKCKLAPSSTLTRLCGPSSASSRALSRGHDFYEGVRAVIIDKDNRPRWNPAAIESVESADIDSYFAPLLEANSILRRNWCRLMKILARTKQNCGAS